MIRMILCLALMWTALPALSQNPEPIIRAELEADETIPGQPVVLRVTVLVPTWMPKAPIWPTFEAPNLMVRLPPRATSPVSERINAETWSGTTRRYNITPMIPGLFVLPADNLRIFLAKPGSIEPVPVDLKTPEMTLRGVIPQGAEGLDPFLAARGLTLTQEIEGTPTNMQAGDSFARVITAEITGIPPMFLPTLTPEAAIDGLRAYPKNPELEETENRGVTSGLRREKTDYLAETGLAGDLPALSIDWFNLDSWKIETASVPAIAVKSAAPPPKKREIDYVQLAIRAVEVIVILLVLRFVLLKISPPISRWRARRRARHEASPEFALKALRHQVKQRDLGQTILAYENWIEKRGYADPTYAARVQDTFNKLGGARYGPEPTEDVTHLWLELEGLVHCLAQQHGRSDRDARPALPALNPLGSS